MKHKRNFCKCGKEKDVRSNWCRDCFCILYKNGEIEILTEKTRETMRNKQRHLPPFRSLYNFLLNSQKHRTKNIIVDLTFDEFLELTKISNCHYCGELVKWEPYRKVGATCAYNLDRKNNKIGYTKENCVVCCKGCNMLKSYFDDNEFLSRIQKISKNLKLC